MTREDLSLEELDEFDRALVRSYVLGLQSTPEEDPEEVLQDLLTVAGSRYEREILVTAFHEGRRNDFDHLRDVDRSALPRFMLDLDIDLGIPDATPQPHHQHAPDALTVTPMHTDQLPAVFRPSLPELLYR